MMAFISPQVKLVSGRKPKNQRFVKDILKSY